MTLERLHQPQRIYWASLGDGARVGGYSHWDVSRTQIKSLGQLRLNELQVPQTASEAGAGGQAVLFDTHCSKDRQVKVGVLLTCEHLSQLNGSHLDVLPGRWGCSFQQRWIVGRGLRWWKFAYLQLSWGCVWFFGLTNGATFHHIASGPQSAPTLDLPHYSHWKPPEEKNRYNFFMQIKLYLHN